MNKFKRLKQVIDYNEKIYMSLTELLLILEYKENEKTSKEIEEELYNIIYTLNHQTETNLYSFVYYKDKYIFFKEDLSCFKKVSNN